MKHSYILTSGDEGHHLLRMALPMMLGISAMLLVNLADTWFVSQLGTDQLSAMGFAFPVVVVTSSLALGVGSGAASAIARGIGANDLERVESYATQAVVIALVVSVLFSAAGLLAGDRLFRSMGAPAQVLVYIRQYMDTWFLGAALVMVPLVGNACIRSAGDARFAAIVMMTVALVNFCLDPVLIFGWLGVPALGMQGAALATLIAFGAASCVSLYMLSVRLRFLTLAGLRHRVAASWKEILRIGIPAAGTSLISPVSAAFVTAFVAVYGSDAVAGFGVASRVEMFALLPLMALAAIMAPFAGQNWGAGKRSRLNRGLGLSLAFSWAWGVLIAVSLWFAGHWVISAFTEDPQAYDSARLYLDLVSITFAFLGIVMVVTSVAQGVGDAMPGLMLTLSRLVLVYLPAAWLLSQWMGLLGIYLAAAIANISVGVAAITWGRYKCSEAGWART